MSMKMGEDYCTKTDIGDDFSLQTEPQPYFLDGIAPARTLPQIAESCLKSLIANPNRSACSLLLQALLFGR